MREIKFRAWIKDCKTGKYNMFNWNPEFFSDMSPVTSYGNEFPEKDDEDIILMQYTGLKDKNGKEIYEGDLIAESTINKPIWDGCGIVEERPIGEVVIRPPFINVEPRKKGKVKIVKIKNKFMKKGEYCELNLSRYDGLFEWHKDDIDIEIIGNIHENPELLEKKK